MITGDTLRALVVRQPFANLIRDGSKKIEVRFWPTTHRGDLLICAAKSADPASEYDGNQPRGVTLLHRVSCLWVGRARWKTRMNREDHGLR